ncbi:MAG: Uma2 family endonuclease [Candidatus Magnetomorum sp.]|nr:Uma2 family endonuclease [Candidatus Magnetomorum sp.]
MQKKQIRYDVKSANRNYNPTVYKGYKKEGLPEPIIETEIDYNQFITEDDEPVDNIFSERQQRLLPDAIHASWEREKPFLSLANVGIYEKNPTTAIVPDVFLSLDVTFAEDIWKKKNRCYFISVFGKPPELVIEIVSNKKGREKRKKRQRYQNMGVKYYVIYDPGLHIYKTTLHAFKLIDHSYVSFSPKDLRSKKLWFDEIDIGLTIQKGIYEQMNADWLRWYDSKGNILKTGEEKAKVATKRADTEKKRADIEKKRADIEKKRAEAAKKKAEAAKEKAEAEKEKAEVEKKKAEAEKEKAEVEKKKAEAEKEKAEAEKKRAETEKKRADTSEKNFKAEKNRADAAEKELALLKEKLGMTRTASR